MSNEQNEKDVEIKDKGVVLVDGTAEDVIAAIPNEKDPAVLKAAVDAESAGKNRKTVLAALDVALNPPASGIEIKPGHAVLKAPKHAGTVSVGGSEYPIEDGHVQVPVHLAHELHAHGFAPKAD